MWNEPNCESSTLDTAKIFGGDVDSVAVKHLSDKTTPACQSVAKFVSLLGCFFQHSPFWGRAKAYQRSKSVFAPIVSHGLAGHVESGRGMDNAAGVWTSGGARPVLQLGSPCS